MSKIANLTFTLLFLSTAIFAQQKYDIVKFTAPTGWQQTEGKSALSMGIDDGKGNMGFVAIYKSVAMEVDSKLAFEVSWDSIVNGIVTVTGQRTQTTEMMDGWKVESGVAQYNGGKLGNIGKGMVLFISATGDGKIVNMVAIANADEYRNAVFALVESIKLPPIKSLPPNVVLDDRVPPPAGADKLIGRWQRSSSVHPRYGDRVKWGMGGYTTSRYEFKRDGTYVQTERTFGMSNSSIIIVKETGKYRLSGNDLTITPITSVVESYAKQGGGDTLGARLSTQKRPLETVKYRFTFHYFSGIKEWNLVLQADKETQREGSFSANKTFPNAWYFDQKFTDGDLTAAKGN